MNNSTNTNQRVKLSEVVSNFLDATDLGDAEYSRAYRIALRGAREFKIDSDGNIQRATLEIKGDYTLYLPSDCIRVVRVCGISANHYSIKGGKVYLKHGCVSGKTVDVEYLALDQDGQEHYINQLFSEALIAYIRYNWFLTKKNNSGWDKQFYKKIYEDELRVAKYRLKAPTIEEMRKSAYGTSKINVK